MAITWWEKLGRAFGENERCGSLSHGVILGGKITLNEARLSHLPVNVLCGGGIKWF